MSTGTSSPQSLKKILSLSEEGNERHRRQPEDTVSNASSQLSSPPTSPQSSPKKGKPIILPPSLLHHLHHDRSFCHHGPHMPPGGCQYALQHVSDSVLGSRTLKYFIPLQTTAAVQTSQDVWLNVGNTIISLNTCVLSCKGNSSRFKATATLLAITGYTTLNWLYYFKQHL